MEVPKYILCIDDDEDDYYLLSSSLQDLQPGVEVKHMYTGDSAIVFLENAVANNTVPDLIVLDYNLPGMSGKETLRHLRRLRELEGVPVIFFSTFVGDADIVEIEREGVSVLMKPASKQGYDHLAQTILMLT